MKKLFSVFLTLILSLSVIFTLTGCEQGSALSYELQSDGTYYVTELLEDTTKVVIPSKYQGKVVSGIAEDAFTNNRTITEVVLPDSVTFIGGSAFRRCSSLSKINLTKVTKLGSNAFSETKLTNVTLSSVVTVGNSAFKDCRALQSVSLSNSTVTIEKSAFSGCLVMTTVDVGKTKNIGDSAFNGCGNINQINLSTVKYIGESAFMGCTNITSVNLKNVIEVNKGAFDGCGKLETIYVGASAKLLHMSAFYGCALTGIYLEDPTGWSRWIVDANNNNKHWESVVYDNSSKDLSDPVVARNEIVPSSWTSKNYFKKAGYVWP